MENNCDGSTRSFAQVYTYGDQELGIPLGFGIDLNGFATQMGPRFGVDACNKADPEDIAAQQQAQEYPLGNLYDTSGLAHMGLLGRGLTADMQNFGVDTSNLFSSTEAFIRMWERAEATLPQGPYGPPPVTEDSEIGRYTTDGTGFQVTTIVPGDSAIPGDYRFRVEAGDDGESIVTLRQNGQILAETSFDGGDTLGEGEWKAFDFSPYLTVKVQAAEGQDPELGDLEEGVFNGQMTLTLDYP